MCRTKDVLLEREVGAWHWLMKWPDAPASEELPAKFHDVGELDFGVERGLLVIHRFLVAW